MVGLIGFSGFIRIDLLEGRTVWEGVGLRGDRICCGGDFVYGGELAR